jgi:hypothetical protein
MLPRSPLVFLAALTLVVSGCSGDSDGTPEGPTSHSTAFTTHVKLPVDRPLLGRRVDGNAWRTSGRVPRRVKGRPYVNGVLLEGQLSQPVDEDGVREYERDGRRYDHPVAIAQYGLAKLDQANQTGSRRALRAAKANGSKLLEIATPVADGIYFAYPFDFSLGGRERETLNAPWWSAMAQGEALSLFVRLYRATGNERWARAADKTFATMDDIGPRKKPWSVYVDRRHYLWFEEYAGNTKPLVVLNGHMFALFGIWDYQRLTGSEEAAELFDAGVTTLREYLPLFREDGEASYYCIRLPLCTQKSWQSEKYHGIVTRQIRFIADMSDDRWFNREANRFQQDFAGWPLPAE